MMNYEKPVVLDNLDSFEGVYASSGSDDGTWSVEVWWEGHNSGSHSEVQLKCHDISGRPGSYLTVTITFTGNANIVDCATPTNATSWSRNGNTITVIRDGSYNAGENFSFMLPSVTFDNPSYPKDSVNHDGSGGWSYYKSDDAAHSHIQAGEWSVSYYYSL